MKRDSRAARSKVLVVVPVRNEEKGLERLLVPLQEVWQAAFPPWLRSGHALVRHRRRGLDNPVDLAERLRGAGYKWTTLSRYHEGLTDRIRR